jgi:hypothetical protein
MRPLNVLRFLEILGRIGDKTSVLVVMPPKDGSRRFSEIAKQFRVCDQLEWVWLGLGHDPRAFSECMSRFGMDST